MNSLKILSPAIRLVLPKLIRQGLAAIGGALAGAGVMDASSDGGALTVPMIITGLLLWAFTAIHSAWVKSPVDAETMGVVKKLMEALIAQGMSFYSGWLATAGFEGDPANAEAVTLFFANLGLSALSRPVDKSKVIDVQATKVTQRK